MELAALPLKMHLLHTQIRDVLDELSSAWGGGSHGQNCVRDLDSCWRIERGGRAARGRGARGRYFWAKVMFLPLPIPTE